MILLWIISPRTLISVSPSSMMTDNRKDKFRLVSCLAEFAIFSCDFAVNPPGEQPVGCHLFPVLSSRIARGSEASTKEKLACEFHSWHRSNCRTTLQEQKLRQQLSTRAKRWNWPRLIWQQQRERGTHVALWSLQPRWIPASPVRLAAVRYVLTESSWNKNKLPEEQKKQFILQAFLSRDNRRWVVGMLKYPFMERTPVDAAALPAEIASVVVVPSSLRQAQESLIGDGT